MRLTARYGLSLACLTDLYQLTMAYGYWKNGMHGDHACFHLFFREPPFGGHYVVAAGLADALDYLQSLRFDDEDLRYLSTLTGPDGSPLFERAFLDCLRDLRLELDVEAMPEGTAVFPNEPLLRVTGPILQCQLVETPLLTIVNFSSLIATKAARVCEAAGWEPVLEFGLRRAQGPDGGIMASRASYVGGCSATSNVMAGRLYGIPVQGTHAHSWVMAWGDDTAAFRAWANAMPRNTVFLVDTYHSTDGIRHAVEVAKAMRADGYEVGGIRLDSGDLAELSKRARTMFDEAGFSNAKIVGSGDLDEHAIADLKRRGCTVGVWGVGTRLSTARDDPALGGVYKLAAFKGRGGEWEPRIKVSDSAAKTTTPGLLQVRRFRSPEGLLADGVWDTLEPPPHEQWVLVDPADPETHRTIPASAAHEDLLVPVVRQGHAVYGPPPLPETRGRTRAQVTSLPEGVRRLRDGESYPVGLEAGLHRRRERMMAEHGRSRGRGERW